MGTPEQSSGKVIGVCVRPGKRVEPEERPSITATGSDGVVDDHGHGPKRQITILSREAWDAATAVVDQADLNWTTRRANVLVEGLDLESLLLGGTLTLGEVTVEVLGETFPCDQMDDACAGLKSALLPETRGGVYGKIVQDGTIAVGAAATITAAGKKKNLP